MKSDLEYVRRSSCPAKCSWCGAAINQGDRFVWFVAWFEGRPDGSCSMHPECYAAMGRVPWLEEFQRYKHVRGSVEYNL